MENNLSEVIKIFEVDYWEANKLLNTGNFNLLGVFKRSTLNPDCPEDQKMMYSLGQVQNGSCSQCNAINTIEYIIDDENFRNVSYIGKCKHCNTKEVLK